MRRWVGWAAALMSARSPMQFKPKSRFDGNDEFLFLLSGVMSLHSTFISKGFLYLGLGPR